MNWRHFILGMLCGAILWAAITGAVRYFELLPAEPDVQFAPGTHVMWLESDMVPKQWYVLYSTVDGEYVFIRNYYWVNIPAQNEYTKWVRTSELRKVVP